MTGGGRRRNEREMSEGGGIEQKNEGQEKGGRRNVGENWNYWNY